ncbi:MAG: PadR family transcriptional regulator [Pseudomonadota bacterium]|nr:PadR family transcriptional regulator [Pseudomonadota bacterium]
MRHGFYQCIGRHRHPGFSHFGRGFLSGGMGGRGFGAGRKLASVDLQLLILKLLDEKSRHGYEIIKELEERSRGFYIPSPGMVYPALTYLEELGHATVASEGARKLYSITKSGKEHLSKHAAAADALIVQFARVGERMDRVRRALGAEETGEDPGIRQERGGARELHAARRELRLALLAKWHSSTEEQQRIAAILARAAAEITGK